MLLRFKNVTLEDNCTALQKIFCTLRETLLKLTNYQTSKKTEAILTKGTSLSIRFYGETNRISHNSVRKSRAKCSNKSLLLWHNIDLKRTSCDRLSAIRSRDYVWTGPFRTINTVVSPSVGLPHGQMLFVSVWSDNLCFHFGVASRVFRVDGVFADVVHANASRLNSSSGDVTFLSIKR